MKKIYIKPSVSVCFAVLDPILLGESGVGKGQSDFGGGGAKKNDFQMISSMTLLGQRTNRHGTKAIRNK